MLQNRFLKGFQKVLKNRIFRLLVLLFLLTTFLLLGYSLYSASEYVKQEHTELIFIQGNSLVAISEPFYTMSREERINLLLEEIVSRESGGDSGICNLEFGCGSGQGLTGVIPSTEKVCEIGLGRELDMFNPEDNLACAKYLLDTEGIWPWEPYSGPYTDILLELDLYEEMYLNPGSLKVEK